MDNKIDVTADIQNNEHLILSSFLKNIHLALRKTVAEVGAEKAWEEHCQNKEVLAKYAKYMELLATKHWTGNNEGLFRISWAASFCETYFLDKQYLIYTEKEENIVNKIGKAVENTENFSTNINLLDVGSCFNPFQEFKFLNVTAIDLYPANDSVFQCDFLKVKTGPFTDIENNNILQLQKESFEAVVFSFLLEYIPTSELRILACAKAYSLLKPGGLLLICTPDSKHVGANAKLMKCWRYTLALLGFSRIHYNKFKFIHCMAFRKCLVKDVAQRWAHLHKETYMQYAINIPQDFNTNPDKNEEVLQGSKSSTASYSLSFEEMPFSDNLF